MSASVVPGSSPIGFDQYFRTHHARLVVCGLALTGDRERAREAADEALGRALRDWDRVRELDSPGAWVRRTLMTVIIDEGRQQDRDRRFAAKLIESGPVPDHDPAWSPLLRAIRELPEQQRVVVVLHHLDDLTLVQVAEVVEASEAAVTTTLFHARAALRDALAAEAGG